jgi:hypothetical protein
MEKQFVTPRFPAIITTILVVAVIAELIIYGITLAVPSLWAPLLFGGFYLGYMAIFRHDALPTIFALVFFTAHHSLLFNLNQQLPIALLFIIIFALNSGIMWLLLHYATHLKRDYHTAYSLISGFMIAQILTLFGTMSRDWPFRLELASYMPSVFSYVFWRFACLSAESMLGWKQFIRVALLVIILILVIILGSPNVQV